jgi:hypothetical protein
MDFISEVGEIPAAFSPSEVAAVAGIRGLFVNVTIA